MGNSPPACAPGHIRVGYGGDEELLREGLRRLGAALDVTSPA